MLKQAGIDAFTILEKADGVGGTWRDNHYPGAACDVPSHLYSFSFEPNPRWSRVFAPQAEILAYLERLRRQVRPAPAPPLRHRGRRGAEFDEARGSWTRAARAAASAVARARSCSATGALSSPSLPGHPRARRASRARRSTRRAGTTTTTSTGKRVAVIGTGASAIQFVPQIAPRSAQLAPLPAHAAVDPAASPTARSGAASARCSQRLPLLQRLASRPASTGRCELRGLGFVVRSDAIIALRARLAAALPRRAGRRPRAAREAHAELPARAASASCMSNDYYPALAAPERRGRHRRHRRRHADAACVTQRRRERARRRASSSAPASRVADYLARHARRRAARRASSTTTWRDGAEALPRHHRRRLPQPVHARWARTPASATTRWSS